MLYPTETGWADAQKFYDEALAGVRAHGLDAKIVSTGGTPNLDNIGKLKGGTEHRFGTYIYNDRMQVAPAPPPGTIARCTSIRRWSAAPRPSAAFWTPARRR